MAEMVRAAAVVSRSFIFFFVIPGICFIVFSLMLVNVNIGKVTAAAYVCKLFYFMYIGCARSVKRGAGLYEISQAASVKGCPLKCTGREGGHNDA